jgi:hypothetical protein
VKHEKPRFRWKLKVNEIYNMTQSDKWNFLIETACCFIKTYTLVSDIQRSECESAEHVAVQKKLDQILTWVIDNGVLVQVPIKATIIDTLFVYVNIEMRSGSRCCC